MTEGPAGHPRAHVLRPVLWTGLVAALIVVAGGLALRQWAFAGLFALIALGAYRNLRMLRDWRPPPRGSGGSDLPDTPAG